MPRNYYDYDNAYGDEFDSVIDQNPGDPTVSDVPYTYSQAELNQRRKAVTGQYIRSGRGVSPYAGLRGQATAPAPNPPTRDPIDDSTNRVSPGEGGAGVTNDNPFGGTGGSYQDHTGAYHPFNPITGQFVEGTVAPGRPGFYSQAYDADNIDLPGMLGVDIGRDMAKDLGIIGTLGMVPTGMQALSLGVPNSMLPGILSGSFVSSALSPAGIGKSTLDAIAGSYDAAQLSSGLETAYGPEAIGTAMDVMSGNVAGAELSRDPAAAGVYSAVTGYQAPTAMQSLTSAIGLPEFDLGPLGTFGGPAPSAVGLSAAEDIAGITEANMGMGFQSTGLVENPDGTLTAGPVAEFGVGPAPISDTVAAAITANPSVAGQILGDPATEALISSPAITDPNTGFIHTGMLHAAGGSLDGLGASTSGGGETSATGYDSVSSGGEGEGGGK